MIALFRLHGLLLRLLFWGLGQAVRLVGWLIKQPLRALSSFFKLTLAYVHMEVKRWAGLIMAGLFVLAIAGFLISTFPGGSNWRILGLLLCLVWLVALFKTLELTAHNRLWRVRGTLAFREIDAKATEARDYARDAAQTAKSTAAKRTRGTPVEGVFRENRSIKVEERDRAHARAEQLEMERREAAEQAARDQQEAARRDRHLDELAAAEPDPFS